MKYSLILALLLAGCASVPSAQSSNDAVKAIQASCDDKNSEQTVINGHAYFCMDFAHFEEQMNAIAKALQERGI